MLVTTCPTADGFTVAWTVSVANASLASVPSVHTPLVASYVPRVALLDTYCSPEGSRSVTDTLVADAGPWFTTPTVYPSAAFTFGSESLTVCVTASSIDGR